MFLLIVFFCIVSLPLREATSKRLVLNLAQINYGPAFNDHLQALALAKFMVETSPVKDVADSLVPWSILIGCQDITADFYIERYIDINTQRIFSPNATETIDAQIALQSAVATPAFFQTELFNYNNYCYFSNGYGKQDPKPSQIFLLAVQEDSWDAFATAISDYSTLVEYLFPGIDKLYSIPFPYVLSFDINSLAASFLNWLPLRQEWIDLGTAVYKEIFGNISEHLGIAPGLRSDRDCDTKYPSNPLFCKITMAQVQSIAALQGWTLPPGMYIAGPYFPRNMDVSDLFLNGAFNYLQYSDPINSDSDRTVIDMVVCIHAKYFIGVEGSKLSENVDRKSVV